MKINIHVKAISTINQIDNAWTDNDYKRLLNELEITDTDKMDSNELVEMFFMAITDIEPEDAAELLLTYKLSNNLTEGQIKQISHDMLVDKIAEEYSDISLHFELYKINQILYKAFNGKFPNILATKVLLDCKIPNAKVMDPSTLLKCLKNGLSDKNLILRLFEDELASEKTFKEAQSIVWQMNTKGNEFEFITSDYWLNQEDFVEMEFETVIE